MTFELTYEHVGGLSAAQLDVYELVVEEALALLGDTESQCHIVVAASPIDGAGRIIGQAAPTHIWRATGLPAQGILTLDGADLIELEQAGSLYAVMLHETLHVLGIGVGPRWQANVSGGRFIGRNAMMAADRLGLDGAVWLETLGGQGTDGSHWSASVFGNELMTGYLRPESVLSEITAGAMADLGYQVDYSVADCSYQLPTKELTVIEPGYTCRGCSTTNTMPYSFIETDGWE